MTQQFGMGYIPDIPTVEDYTVEDVKKELPKEILNGLNKIDTPVLPTEVDNRKWCSAIQAQGTLGSCTAQAAISMMEYMQNKVYGSYQDGSRLFVYWNTRSYMGPQYINIDSGAFNRLTMKTIVKLGIPEEVNWKYNVNVFTKEPPKSVYDDAVSNKAVKYFRLDGDSQYGEVYTNRIKTFLSNGYAMMTGFPGYDNIYKVTKSNPVLQFPNKTNKLLGGHAVMLCGYSDDMPYNVGKGCFLAQNSWDTSYGDGGFFYIPYKFFNDAMAIDTWAATDIEWVNTGVFA